ncbi:MAG: methyltransferase domain-containing protein [Ignavibacteriae bacterium]|nr:methyltransferase domain-containing protein [Ignavibacteriota bacterium]
MRFLTFRERLSAHLNLLPTAVYDAFPAVLFGRMLVLATRLGFFEALDRQPKTIAELATSLRLHPDSVGLIASSLAANGYLKQTARKYSLAPQAKKWLIKSSPSYLGNLLNYVEILHSHWMYLEETLKHGKPPKPYTEMFAEKEWEIYTYGMMDLARLLLPHISSKLKLPSNAKTLLDIGGSHGLYSIELCKRYILLHATIADFPQVLTCTQQIIKEHRLEHRITLLPCDVTKGSFNTGRYDVVLAFNIVHSFSSEMNVQFFEKTAAALKPGGVVYILDQLKKERAAGVDKLLPLMAGLNILNEIGGNVYSFEEIEQWCESSGLRNVKHHKLSIPGVSLVRAEKSKNSLVTQ